MQKTTEATEELRNYLPRSVAGSPVPINAPPENPEDTESISLLQVLFGVRCLGSALESGDSSPHSKEKLPTEALCHHAGNYKTPENTAFFFAFFTLSAPAGYFPGAWHSKNTQASVMIDG